METKSKLDTLLVSSMGDLDALETTLEGESVIGFDCEGVSLSRLGSITLVAIATEKDGNIFLLDMLTEDEELLEAQKKVLKKVLEDEDKEKIIHDCRQDSDALQYLFDIGLKNVFDTQIGHMAIFQESTQRPPLNATLSLFGCEENSARGDVKVKYENNPRYWETRPLSESMVTCAVGDVSKLFDLKKAQLHAIQNDKEKEKELKTKFETALDCFRSCQHHKVVSCQSSLMGKVIGRNGANISQIERKTNTFVSSRTGMGGFLILARDQEQLEKAEKLIGQYANRKPPSYYWQDY